MEARVSSALVHYHFETRDALLAEALEYSYAHAGDARIGDVASCRRHRTPSVLQSMIEQCLPTTAAARRGLGAVGRAVAARGPRTRS